MLTIGRGMMAGAFKECGAGDPGLLVFASGVSNSAESDALRFAREAALLSETIAAHPDHKIVYFSSCAIGFLHTPYYRHKLAMERLVEQSAARYLVCRLPQVVGLTANTTLVSHIVRSIRARTAISVLPNARRSLIDVDDVVRIVLRLAHLPNMTLQVTSGAAIDIDSLIREVATLLEIEPVLTIGQPEATGVNYDGSALQGLLGRDDRIFAPGYDRDVLRKYVLRMT